MVEASRGAALRCQASFQGGRLEASISCPGGPALQGSAYSQPRQGRAARLQAVCAVRHEAAPSAGLQRLAGAALGAAAAATLLVAPLPADAVSGGGGRPGRLCRAGTAALLGILFRNCSNHVCQDATCLYAAHFFRMSSTQAPARPCVSRTLRGRTCPTSGSTRRTCAAATSAGPGCRCGAMLTSLS